MTARAGDAELGDDAQRHVLGRHLRAEPAFEAYQHALRTPQRHHLRRQDVRELRGAAAEGECAEAAHRAGMAVGNGVGRARQHHAELRRDDVGDALLGVIDVKNSDVVAAAALAHRLDERRAGWIGTVVAAGSGGDGMILHGECEIGPAHRPPLLLQLLEGVGRVQLVQYVPVDVDEIAAVGRAAPPDARPRSCRTGSRSWRQYFRIGQRDSLRLAWHAFHWPRDRNGRADRHCKSISCEKKIHPRTKSGGGAQERLSTCDLGEPDVLQRQAAYRLAGRGVDGVEHGGRDHADRGFADATPEVMGRHDDRFHFRHLGEPHDLIGVEVQIHHAAVLDLALAV